MWLPMTRRRRGVCDRGAGRLVIERWTGNRPNRTLGIVVAALVLVPDFDNLSKRRTPKITTDCHPLILT